MRAATAFILLSPIALSACGGATTSNVDTYEDIRTSMAVPFAEEILDDTANELTTTPVESSASMSGIFIVDVATDPFIDSIAGQIDMNANFASSTVSGTMSDFIEVYDGFGTDIDGSVTYSGTVNVGAGALDDISATGTGSLTTTDGTTHSVATTMDGDVLRRAGGELGAAGNIDATATSIYGTESATGIYIVSE